MVVKEWGQSLKMTLLVSVRVVIGIKINLVLKPAPLSTEVPRGVYPSRPGVCVVGGGRYTE